MGITGVLHIKAPLWLLRLICNANTLLSKVTGKLTALNNDKYHILKQRNWRCDISPITALGYEPHYNLEKGVRETIAWYKKEKWI
jgi:nucleoside-diphosphate-sugar epimerase